MKQFGTILLVALFLLLDANSAQANDVLDSLMNRLTELEHQNTSIDLREKAHLSSEIADWYNKVYTDQDYSRTYLIKATTYIKQIENRQDLLPEDVLYLSDLYRRLSLYELNLGNVTESDAYMQQCERLLLASKNIVPKADYTKALYDFYHSYFALNFNVGKLDKALYYINEAYAVLNANPALAAGEINILSEKAVLFSLMGRHDEAIKFSKRALDLFEANPPDDQPRDRFIYFYIRTLFLAKQYENLLAVLATYEAYTDFNSLEKYLNTNEEMVTRTFFENLFMSAISNHEIYLKTKNRAYIEAAYQRFIDGFKLGENLTIKHNGDKIGNTILRPKNKIISLLKAYSDLSLLEGKADEEKVIRILGIIDAYQSSRLHLERISHAMNADLWVREKELKNEIGFLNIKISELDSIPSEKSKVDSLSQVIQENTMELRDLNALTKRDQVMEQYKISQANFGAGIKDYISTHNKTLVTYFYDDADSTIYTLGISPNNSFFTRTKLAYNLVELISNAYDMNSTLQMDEEAILKQRGFNQQLYEALIAPVSEELKTEGLLIYPLNEISYVSFDALIAPEDVYLVERNQIQYTSSLFSIINSRPKKDYETDLMAYYPTNYGTDSLAVLTNAHEEVLEISKMFEKSILATDNLATKKLFMNNSGDHKIVHLATHSMLNFTRPYESYIVFDATENPDSNHLYAYEIFSKTIKSELVVLSSCNSGRGELKEGIGVLSLSNAFYFAGIPATISSLWSAQDQSAADIMRLFYQGIQAGETKSKSLQSAKVDYLKSADKIHKQPFFWANYVVYGDDEALFEPHSNSQWMKSNWMYFLLGAGGLLVMGLLLRFYFKSSSKSAASVE